MRPEFIVRLRLQGAAPPLDAGRIARLVEDDPRNADARKIARCDKSRKKVELPVRTAHGRWIQHAFDLVGIARLRLHDLPEALQLESVNRDVRNHGSVFLCRLEFRTTFTISRINNGIAPMASSRKQSESGMDDVFRKLPSVAL